jgi:hypothetical protein
MKSIRRWLFNGLALVSLLALPASIAFTWNFRNANPMTIRFPSLREFLVYSDNTFMLYADVDTMDMPNPVVAEVSTPTIMVVSSVVLIGWFFHRFWYQGSCIRPDGASDGSHG